MGINFIKPSSYYDAYQIGWYLFPNDAETIKTLGPVLVKWTTVGARAPYGYASNYPQPGVGYMSFDGGITWIEYSYDWFWKNKASTNSKILDRAVADDQALHRKTRRKRLAAERKAINEAEAAREGITVKALIQRRKKECEVRLAEQQLLASARTTQNFVVAGPVLKKLHDDLGAFLGLIAQGNIPKLPHFSRKLRRIKIASADIRDWLAAAEKKNKTRKSGL